jgi:hypothetical protein
MLRTSTPYRAWDDSQVRRASQWRRGAHVQPLLILRGQAREVQILAVVRPEARVDKLAKERVVEERHRKLLVVLELVVPVDRNGFKVAREGAEQHDEARDDGRAAVVRAEDDDVAAAAGRAALEVPAVELGEQVRRVEVRGRVVLAVEQVDLACSTQSCGARRGSCVPLCMQSSRGGLCPAGHACVLWSALSRHEVSSATVGLFLHHPALPPQQDTCASHY